MPPASKPKASEQRDSPRASFVNFAWFRRVDDPGSAADEGVARACDLSRKGAGIVTTVRLPVGAQVFLEVISTQGNFSAIGRVMHCTKIDGGQFRVGIHIEFVPPTDHATLERILELSPV